MAYATITNGSIDQDSPITQPLMTAYRDNQRMALQGTWMPYDMAEPNDGVDGLIYDFAVDGAVASVETAAFEDGFEYRVVWDGIAPETTNPFLLYLYGEILVGYADPTEISGSVTSGSGVVTSGTLDITVPRNVRKTHFATGASSVSTLSAVAAGGVFTVAQKVGRAKLGFVSGNIGAGTIHVYRRRVYP